ncbi:hypothetical protein [Halomonas sp. GT]|uniref:hypothetical protein n=1 Tax=Halomonas sp. GT TaxID=1971364 RepID=UPI0009F1DE1A|nr:hypothetical protein [Halomonas sp. GT]
MSEKTSDLQTSILNYISENNHAHNWVPIEPESFEERPLAELVSSCKKLEDAGLLEMDYPAASLFAIKPGGERVSISDPNSTLLCAITVNGIREINS